MLTTGAMYWLQPAEPPARSPSIWSVAVLPSAVSTQLVSASVGDVASAGDGDWADATPAMATMSAAATVALVSCRM